MKTKIAFCIHRRIAGNLLAAAIIASWLAPVAEAQNQTVRFEFRPHCEAAESCPAFDIRDPQSLQTNIMQSGNTLDMDLIIRNPEKKPVNRFRAWIAYDPTLLKGEEITVVEAFPVPTPGETEFFENEGYAKISGTAQEAVTDEIIVVARLKFTVTSLRDAGTPITFYDNSETEDAETGIFVGSGPEEENIISRNPGYLFVRMQPPASSSSSLNIQSSISSSVITSSNSSLPASSSASAATTVFTMLQVQGVRLTTEGSTVFLAWDALPSSELVGYNVYYGTVSGRYVQRRSVDKASISLSIRALPVGTTYYFALRGVNDKGQETEFSREVGISVGNPKTSTSPLVAGTISPTTPKTNGDIPGNTGIPSGIALLVIVSAVIGTFLAFRRQFHASITPHA